MKQLFELPVEKTPFLVDGLLPTGGFSMLVGKPKAGKSTLARQLAMAVAKGTQFLDRNTEQGTVLYFGLEEKASEIKNCFHLLGADDSDPLLTVTGSVPKRAATAMLQETLRRLPEIKLVIIDPLFRFLAVKDNNEYVPVNNELEGLMEIARNSNAHIIAVHHMKKKVTEDPIDGACGSTAMVAGVDTYLALNTEQSAQRTICTRQRYGSDMELTRLTWNPERRDFSLGLTCARVALAEAGQTRERIRIDMVKYVTEHDGCEQASMLEEVQGKTETRKSILRELLDLKVIARFGSGSKGDPYTLRIAPAEASLIPVVGTEPA